ncbi:MAG: NAD(P)H-dependent glycerol-3-phosphate dehydrogenase [Proteobacteria bacterium]|nr:NAD(P)H-dependent glycerol-3-phosphate dehydrogenase [Pseudomonadota bacterium]
MDFERIAIVGAGAWGIALGNVIARAGRAVVLVARDARLADAMHRERRSARLPGVAVEAAVTVTSAIAEAATADAVLLVVPAQALRAAATALAGAVGAAGAQMPVVACAKGIETGSGLFMTEVIAQCLPRARPAILSGPSFAADVARGLPTAVTLAAHEEALAAALARAIGSPTFRPYHSTDVRGVEIGGAAKNVLAIAAGIVAGRGLGASAAAALIARGFAEIVRLGRDFGARAETLMGLSGLGDLILTCSSPQSRNFALGVALGQGAAGASASNKLTEGVPTASALDQIARQRGIDMPISTAVAAILDARLDVDAAIGSLLNRPLKGEG